MNKMDIVILVIVAIGLAVLIFKKKKAVIINEIKDDRAEDTELKYLKVYCESCENAEIKSGSVIPIKKSGCFSVKGYSLEGKEVKLNFSQLSWSSPCGCVNFANKTALDNCISCSLGKVRGISVKYTNGVSFNWRIDFGS